MTTHLPDPYAWAIEYSYDRIAHKPMTCFVRRTTEHDRAYVERRAAELHGQIVTLANINDDTEGEPNGKAAGP